MPTSGVLCAVLALVESRLTGATSVAASVQRQQHGAVASLQLPLPTPRSGDAGTWLGHSLAAIATGATASAPAPWIVTINEPLRPAASLADEGNPSFSSQWHLDSSNPALLRVDFRAPMSPVAVDILFHCVDTVLTTLHASPDLALADLEVRSPAERERVLHTWNDTARQRIASDTVHGVFAATVREHAADIAIACGDLALTYAELDTRSSDVACGLQAAGVRAGSLVALLLERLCPSRRSCLHGPSQRVQPT
ncbi:MAG: hypothetical protein WDW38_003634 [Sanguina aurantia]